jgi:tetratricopeptide (TPR) repeat protein
LRGVLAREEGRYDEARADFEAGERLAERAGAPRYAAEAAYQRAGIALYQGDAQGSLRDTRAVLDRIRGLGFARLECSMHYTVGSILEQLGRFAEATAAFRACLDTALACNYRLGELMGRMSWGVMRGWAGDLRPALENMRVALDLAEQVGHQVAERSVRCSAALLYADLGRRAEAEHQARRALQQSRDEGHRRDEGSALQRLARVQRMAHDYAEAARSVAAARAVFETLDEQATLTWLRAERGWIALGAGDRAGARRDLERAVAALREHSPGLGLRFAELYLAQLELDEGRPARAAHRVAPLLEALRDAGYAELEAAALTLRGWARLPDEPAAAAEDFRAASDRREAMGQAHLRAEPAAGLALSVARTGDLAAAVQQAAACLPTVEAGRYFGIPAPARMLVALRDALAAAGDARSGDVERAGRRWIAARAATLATAEERARFLDGSPERRALQTG